MTATSAELVGPLPLVMFRGGPTHDEPRLWQTVSYRPPRNTCDPRYVGCTRHRVACDCREAEWAEERSEWAAERRERERAAWQALAGHLVHPPMWVSDAAWEAFPVCLCSGCAIHRATHRSLLPIGAVDLDTGRVRPFPQDGPR